MPQRLLSKPWIESFQDYMQQSDAPDQYIFWCGIAVAAAALKRNAFYKRKLQIIYPNQYIVLTGPPGSGKGSALLPALKILKASGTVNLLYGRMSAENLVKTIATGHAAPQATQNGTVRFGSKDTSACIFESELPVLFGISDWMIDCFNDLWDRGETDHSTNSSSKTEIRDCSLTILGGCVPEFLKNISRSKTTMTVSGGFTSRSIFTFAAQPRKTSNYWGDDAVTSTSLVTEHQLIEDLKYIATYCIGEYTFTDKAKRLVELINKEAQSDVDKNGNLIYDSDVIRFFKNRFSTHVAKVAMVLAASQDDSRTVTDRHVALAYRELEAVKANLDITFRFMGESKDIDAQSRILDFIKKKGQTSRNEILLYLKQHVTKDQMERVLTVLEAAGDIADTYYAGKGIVITYLGSKGAAASNSGVQNQNP